MKKELDNYTKRLVEEWELHEKIVIAVDFDDVIHSWNKLSNKEDSLRSVELIKEAYKVGAYIAIFSSTTYDRFSYIKEYCADLGIHIDSINENPIPMNYGYHGKIYYNIHLCSRSGLVESLDRLEKAMYMQKGKLEKQKLEKLYNL